MTARERAKLVISLQLKMLVETPPEEWPKKEESALLSPRIYQIEQLVRSCPPQQAKDYNFYISLKQYIWEHVIDDIRDTLFTLEMLSGSVATLLYLMGIAPFISDATDQLRRLPKIVTKEEYDQAVIEARAQERSEILPLDGHYDLAKLEAFYRLIQEKHIQAGDFEAYRDYMGHYGQTEEGLIKAKIASVREHMDTYKKRKQRMGGDKPMLDYVEQYINMSGEQIVERVRQNYEGQFDIPTKEEYERWQRTVDEERNRLHEAIEKGIILKKENGIEAGSYYDWKDRFQKFAGDEGAESRHWNPLHEECMEIGYSDGKVMASSLAKHGDWRNIAAVTIHNKESMGYAGDDMGQRRLDSVIELLEALNPIVLSPKNFDTEVRTFSLRLEEHKKTLTEFTKGANAQLKTLFNKVALIKAVEDGYFDGMAIVIRGEVLRFLNIETLKERAIYLTEYHNNKIREIVTLYNKLCSGLWDYKLIDIDMYLLNPDLQVDETWVDEELERVRQKLLKE